MDYRKLPPIPRLQVTSADSPSTPVSCLKSPGHAGWAKFKADHPDDFIQPPPPLMTDVSPQTVESHGDVDLR